MFWWESILKTLILRVIHNEAEADEQAKRAFKHVLSFKFSAGNNFSVSRGELLASDFASRK